MDKFLLAYIKQRMKEMGICHFHFEPVRVLLNPKIPVQIQAYNEFYYLTGIPLPSGIQIVSDTNILIAEPATFARFTDTGSYTFYSIQEFSGLIEMSFTGATDFNPTANLEFIHVVPACEEKFCAKRFCCEEQSAVCSSSKQ